MMQQQLSFPQYKIYLLEQTDHAKILQEPVKTTVTSRTPPASYLDDLKIGLPTQTRQKIFKNFSPVEANTWFVKGIGGVKLAVRDCGSIEFTASVDGTKRSAHIETVLYVPDLGVNLLSIAAITEVGVTVHFIESHVSFNKNNSIVMVGERIGKTLYHLAITVDPSWHRSLLGSDHETTSFGLVTTRSKNQVMSDLLSIAHAWSRPIEIIR